MIQLSNLWNVMFLLKLIKIIIRWKITVILRHFHKTIYKRSLFKLVWKLNVCRLNIYTYVSIFKESSF